MGEEREEEEEEKGKKKKEKRKEKRKMNEQVDICHVSSSHWELFFNFSKF